ncbi:unnamed protein product, partial [Cylicostephanus goldi]
NKEQYEQAQDTVECYAAYHRYKYHYVNVEDNSSLSLACPQKDFMFQRHCVVAQMLSSWSEDWLLFLDADMAVVNPNHLIEEYIPANPDIHVVFYNRIFNHEVMAGSYLLRILFFRSTATLVGLSRVYGVSSEMASTAPLAERVQHVEITARNLSGVGPPVTAECRARRNSCSTSVAVVSCALPLYLLRRGDPYREGFSHSTRGLSALSDLFLFSTARI